MKFCYFSRGANPSQA